MPWLVAGATIGLIGSAGTVAALRGLEAKRLGRASVTIVEAPANEPHATAPAPPPPQANDGIPTVSVDTLPIVPQTKGTLRFTPSAKGHRVYVDGVVRGNGDAPIDVRCGRHDVRVGSQGELRTIDVPCGGDVLVQGP